MSILLEKFLIKNNYTHFNKHDISLQLLIHPNNPSFRAMTDTLDYFGIDNLAANVPEDALELLPNDFLTVIDENGSKLVLATKKNNCILTEDEEGKKIKYPTIDFKKKWSKNIIAIEKTTNKKNFSSLKRFWTTVPFILLLICLYFQQPSFLQIIKVILSGLGLFISYLLVKEKIGYHSPSVLAVCTSLPNSNCNDVINSKGGNLTKEVSLADASFLYFLILLFNNLFLGENIFTTIMLFSALPIMLYSIYYQGVILKKWCLLCLGVLVVLSLLSLTLLLDIAMEISNMQLLIFLTFLSLILPAYFYAKTLIEVNKKNEQEIIISKRFKRNPETIKKIMADSIVVQNTSALENEIIIGNKAATKKIIAFTNPLCGFCKKAFEGYLKLIAMNPEIGIFIRFSTQPTDLEAPSTKISSRLIEIYRSDLVEEFINTYLDWFKNKDLNEFIRKHGSPKFDENTLITLEQHKKWAIDNGIVFTPTTIINDLVFPSDYDYDDLVYIINDIFEVQSKKMNGL